MTTEETKPVEREAFERWFLTQKDQPTIWESWQASADAALERAAQLFVSGKIGSVEAAADAIRALKGRE